MNDKVLVIAAHADDEVLGCGGTMAKHIANGDQVSVVFMTDGVSSRTATASNELEQRTSASHQAMELIGINDIRQFNFPDNKMDTVALLEIVQAIELVINDIAPDTVYTHFAHDLNIDHQITHKAVMTACRPQPWSSVKKILSFEVLSSTEWNSSAQPSFFPQYISDISNFWDLKLKALKCYQDEMRKFPHSRSYKCVGALSTFRGASYGFEKAEAFFIERILD